MNDCTSIESVLDLLFEDLWLRVFIFLEIKDIIPLELVSKSMKETVELYYQKYNRLCMFPKQEKGNDVVYRLVKGKRSFATIPNLAKPELTVFKNHGSEEQDVSVFKRHIPSECKFCKKNGFCTLKIRKFVTEGGHSIEGKFYVGDEQELFEDTGIDVRDKFLTFGFVGELSRKIRHAKLFELLCKKTNPKFIENRELNKHFQVMYLMRNVVYESKEYGMGKRDRIKQVAQKLANNFRTPLSYCEKRYYNGRVYPE